jgi:hypothetical protein
MKSRWIECRWVVTQSALPRWHTDVISRDCTVARDWAWPRCRPATGRCIAFSSLCLLFLVLILRTPFVLVTAHHPALSPLHSDTALVGSSVNSCPTHPRSEPRHGTAHDRPMPGESAVRRSSGHPGLAQRCVRYLDVVTRAIASCPPAVVRGITNPAASAQYKTGKTLGRCVRFRFVSSAGSTMRRY